MTDATEVTRRIALTLGGTGALGGALLLAGCAPGDAGAGSGGSGAGDGSTDDSGGAAPAAGTEVVALADVPVGGSLGVQVDGQPVLVAQPTAGEVVAFSAICTHQQCVVAAAGTKFECPCHGSTYDAATGDVLVGPALKPLPPFAVKVDGDRIVTGS